MLKGSPTLLPILGLLFFTCSRPARADEAPSGNYLDRGSARMLASADTQFALQAVQESLAAIQLGKLASAKANDPAVRSFGADMAAKNAKADAQLRDIARTERMTLPDLASSSGQALYLKLTRSPAAAFDKSYVSHLLKALRKRVKASAKEAAKGDDPLIANFAARELPALEQDLIQLKSLQPRVARLNRN